MKIGGNWSVSSDAKKPIDNRTKMNSKFERLDYSFDAIDKKTIEILQKMVYNTIIWRK